MPGFVSEISDFYDAIGGFKEQEPHYLQDNFTTLQSLYHCSTTTLLLKKTTKMTGINERLAEAVCITSSLVIRLGSYVFLRWVRQSKE